MCRNKNIKFYTQHQEINWLKLNAKANHRAGLQSTMYSPSLFYCSRLKPNIQSKTQLISPPPENLFFTKSLPSQEMHFLQLNLIQMTKQET